MYTGYELLWLFFSASFLGWGLETASAALSRRKFTNRGIVNAPFCIIYGVALTVITIFCQELHGFWLFAECMILAAVIEWAAGHLIERMYHERWWDYSNRKWNLDGYICLPASVLWGAFGAVMMRWGNPLLEDICHLLPYTVGRIVLWVLVGVLALNMAATLIILSGRSRRMEQWEAVDSWLTGISSNLERKIYGWIDRRIRRAYPEKEGKRAEILAEKAERDEMSSTVFAYGCGFYKIVWLFLIDTYLWQAHFWEERMSICAACSQKSYLARCSGITAIFRSIWAAGSINMIVSIMALVRSDQRAHDVKAAYSWQQTMDERFDDARLQRIYPNALKVE